MIYEYAKMTKLRRNIEEIINGTEQADQSGLARLLHAASRLYGTAVSLRAKMYDRGRRDVFRLPCRVISVGNITAGGTGKTPMTIHLAKMIREMGYESAVLSRGYKGTAEKAGVMVSDGERLFCGPQTAGDEPFMMAASLAGVPVLVSANRYASGLRAVEAFHPDVIILDDAFQHRRLHRDLNLVMVDDTRLFGNRHLLPRGPLREPLAGLCRADAFVLTRCDAKSRSLDRLKQMAPGKPVFRTFHRPYVHGVYNGAQPLNQTIRPAADGADIQFLETARVVGFSGIAQNDAFYQMVRSLSAEVAAFKSFPDHHAYTDTDLARIATLAEEGPADYIITTMKDFVRAAGRIPGNLPVVVIGVEIAFLEKDEALFSEFIRKSAFNR